MGRVKWHGAKANGRICSPLAKHIGSQLLLLRQKHQMAMDQVAAGSKLSKTFICQIENGQSCPSAETLWRLSQFFVVPIGYFFRGYPVSIEEIRQPGQYAQVQGTLDKVGAGHAP